MPIEVRPESTADADAVRAVNAAAFPTEAEAQLVDKLRAAADPIVSLVAIDAGNVVGHILFSPVELASAGDRLVMGLAPMAVHPDRQRSGIGSALVERGLAECRRLGAAAVVVLGHATYYPRFGFAPASAFGVRSQYDVPDEAFMLLELDPGALDRERCTARYHEVFDTL